MAFFKRQKRNKGAVMLANSQQFADICCSGYTSLVRNPEIVAGVSKIADLVSSMPIHLMQNQTGGDVRIKNELSRMLDITPNRYMNRTNFIRWVVQTMLLDGNGNAVVLPITERGYLRELIPQPPYAVSFISGDLNWDYKINIGGAEYAPSDCLHFVSNPQAEYPWRGQGYQLVLRDVVQNLSQAAATTKGFMASKWKPSVVINVDGNADIFSNMASRKKLLNEYVETSEIGEPWIIPSEQFSIEQIRPLSLSDLAISDCVQLDKRTVAAVLGVPSFVLGVGEFRRDEWNNFVSTKIMPIAQILEQEFTRKILISEDLYFKFNNRSLYNYDLKDLAQIADDQYIRGIMTGNEVRDWLGLSPCEGLDELVILENYIPLGKIGDQNKLAQTGGDESD